MENEYSYDIISIYAILALVGIVGFIISPYIYRSDDPLLDLYDDPKLN